jgi:hypothetical protein
MLWKYPGVSGDNRIRRSCQWHDEVFIEVVIVHVMGPVLMFFNLYTTVIIDAVTYII